jgi:DNA-binding beta-propeller fold protein YncE
MLRRSTTVTLAAGLVLSTVALPASGQVAGFGDVPPGNTHAAAIEEASGLGIVEGTSPTTFSPARAVTRGQVASLIVRTLEEAGLELPPLAGAPTFSDVGPPHGDNVRRLAAADVVTGRGDGSFDPGGPVTRDQLASLFVRALSFALGEDVVPEERGYFSDVTGGVHAANVDAAFERGLLQGRDDGRFVPAASTRRDQAATVIVRFLDAVRDGAGPADPVVTDGGELWVLDQGTDLIHVYDATDGIDEVVTVDVRPAVLRAARDAGDLTAAPAGELTVPHMIEFDSQQRYAFIASTAGGVTIVVDARTKEVVEVLATGAGTHMADVTPDDAALWVSVIGTAGRTSNGSQKLVEVALPDLDAADPAFAITDTLLVEDLIEPYEDGTEASYTYPSFSAVCHQFSPDSSEAWITLGPSWSQGGLLVLDLDTKQLEAAYDPAVVKANCGLSITEDRALANWSGRVVAGDDSEGEWYVFDRDTKELLETRPSEGLDTHGLRLAPDGSEYWQVNRNSDDAIVIDADTLEVTRRIADVAETPDILDYSPDGRFVYITQRGPTPRSGAIHAAAGTTPGVAVVDRATGEEVTVLTQPTITSPSGAVLNDVHGIAVRAPTPEDAEPAEIEVGAEVSTATVRFDAPRPEPVATGFHCGLGAA